MLRRRLWVVVVVLAAFVALGSARQLVDDEPPAAVQTTTTEPFVVDVTLDPEGRPYDATLRRGSRVARRPLTVLHAPSRRVLFMGGEYLAFPDDTVSRVTLADRAGRRFPVHAIWEVGMRTASSGIVGVVIVEREAPIVSWQILDKGAYLTDGGVGGITTDEWAQAEKPVGNEVDRLYESELVEKGRQYFAGDVDGSPGIDTIGFANGWGDGIFPSIAGYDASGERVEIVLWTKVVPWRLAFPAGKPPVEVTKTENELAECLAGRRKFQGSRCRIAP